MTVSLYDGSAGLFDILGKVWYAAQVEQTSAATTVPAELLDILTQFENVGDDLELSDTTASVSAANDAYKSGAESSLSLLRTFCRDYLTEIVHDDVSLATKTFQAALAELIDQMDENSESVDANTITVTPAAVGTPDGDGLVVVTEKRGDGLVNEHSYAEVITLEALTDRPASLTVSTGESADLLSVDWPIKSGAGGTLSVTAVGSGLIPEGNFDTVSTDDSSLPKGWIQTVGSPGVAIALTSPEVQTVTISGTPTGGYYILHWTDGAGESHSTDPIAYNAAATSVQSALRKVPGLSKVTVTATGTSPNYTHTVTFLGAGGNVSALTSTNRMTGATGTDEVQTLTLSNAEGGTFTLTWDFGSGDETTSAIAYNATAATVQTAILALTTPGAGDVVCTGGPLPSTAVVITFTGSLATTNIAAGTVDAGSLTGSTPAIAVAETTKGVPAQNEIQTLTLYGASGGTITLSLDGKESAAIAYNAANATLDTAVEAIDGVDTVTIGSGPLPAATTIEFTGDLADTAVNMLVVNVDDLTSSISASVSETTPGVAAGNEKAVLYELGSQYMQFLIDDTGTVSGGTYDITFNSITTADIPWDATAWEVCGLLQADHSGYAFASYGIYTNDPTDTTGVRIAVVHPSENDFSVPTIDSTNLTGGGSYQATKTATGSSSHDDTAASVRFQYGTETSDPFAWGPQLSQPTASGMQALLEDFTDIGSGNVTVTKPDSSTKLFVIEFVGDLAEDNVATPTLFQALNSGAGVTLAGVQNGGSGGTSEVQELSIAGSPSQGTFDLYYGLSYVTLAYNASAATVQTALRTISGLSAVTCSGGALPGTAIDVTFPSVLGDVALMTVDDSKLKYSIAETQTGSVGTDEVQTVTISNTSGGTFTLTHSAATTSAIAYGATAATVKGALDALGIGTFTVTGTNPYVITFGGALAATDVAAFTYATASLTGSTASGSITETTQGSTSSGAITHATTTSGTAQVYSGTYAVAMAGDGSTLTEMVYKLSGLTAETCYALNAFLTVAASAASGVLTFSLVDGIGGSVINDQQGNANTLTVNATDLTTSWQALADVLASGVPVFRTPRKMPSSVYLRVKWTTALQSGKTAYLDHLALVKMSELYAGGPFAAVFGGAADFRIGDAWTITVTNDRAGTVHEWANRMFDLAASRLLLPSATGGGETVPDTVIS